MAHRRTRISTFEYAAQLCHHLTEAEARLWQPAPVAYGIWRWDHEPPSWVGGRFFYCCILL